MSSDWTYQCPKVESVSFPVPPEAAASLTEMPAAKEGDPGLGATVPCGTQSYSEQPPNGTD